MRLRHRAVLAYRHVLNIVMFHKIALTLVVVVAGHVCLASPVPEPNPGYHKTHIKVHVPHEVHTVHHHHVSKIPVIKEVPVLHEVPVIKHVPVYKTVPVIKHVPVPIVNTVHVEKPVIVPVHHEITHWGGWL